MFARFLSFISGAGVGFYINKNLPPDPKIATIADFVKKDDQQNIVINTSGIMQGIRKMLDSLDQNVTQATQGVEPQFAPKLVLKADRMVVQNLTPTTEVSITIKEGYKIVTLQEEDKKHCTLWGCPKNRLDSVVDKDLQIQLPPGIKAKFK